MAELEARRWKYIDLSTGKEVAVRKRRTGPYRLADGEWSDGVNREKRIADQHRGDECISRMYVWQFHSAYYDKSMWAVARSEPYTDQDFHKFAEAIAYADRMARGERG